MSSPVSRTYRIAQNSGRGNFGESKLFRQCFAPLNLSFNLLYTIMVTNLPKFSSPTLIVHQFANVFPCKNFALYGSVHLQWISQVQSVTHSRAYTHITSVCHWMYQLEREKLEAELVGT